MNKSALSLAGNWKCNLDFKDKGLEEKWFANIINDSIVKIPGTTTENGIGNKVVIENSLTKEAVRCLRQDYQYIGPAWYQTEFSLNKDFIDKGVILYLERVMFESRVWVDNNYIGKNDSLCTPHQYDITKYVEDNKKHNLTIRIDNRDVENIGPFSSAYTDETQTIWNGIIGNVELRTNNSQPESLILTTDSEKKVVNYKLIPKSKLSENEKYISNILIYDNDKLVSQQKNNSYCDSNNEICDNFNLPKDVKLWSEFEPKVYKIEIEITDQNNKIICKTIRTTGFCDARASGKQITVNGVKTFLRGNIDCCIYPETAHPPMNKDKWIDVIKTTKEYGLNLIRFHSWCPPQVAFEVADELGVYFQIEGPVWMDNWTGYSVGKYPEHYTYLPKEAERIISEYSWHSSFIIFSNGNELNGDFKLLGSIISGVRKINPYLIYTLSTNWDRKVDSQDDIFIAQSANDIGIRGQYYLDKMVDGTKLEFDKGVDTQSIPVISHEVGQYCVYPNTEEIDKYTGALKPVNLQAIESDLRDKDLLRYISKYVYASGKLSEFLYKAEIEAALRTKDLAGIQLLGLHDFPGQSTATIGMLDAFFDSKGIVSKDEFSQFCCQTVPLIIMDKFIYTTKDIFEAEVKIAHYGLTPLKNTKIEISLTLNSGEMVYSKEFTADNIPIGLYKNDFKISQNIFKNLKGRNRLKVNAKIVGTPYKNSWDIWVYEEIKGNIDYKNIYTSWNNEIEQKLLKGENVLLIPDAKVMENMCVSNYFPVFWSPVHFTSKSFCGMYIDNTHPLFKDYFVCNDYADYEWKAVLENSSAINMDKLKDFEPIDMMIPNFFNNHKCSNLFEANVLNGKVVVCCIDIQKSEYPQISYFKKAIIDYMTSNKFEPSQNLNPSDLKELFKEVKLETDKRDIALEKPAMADSEKSKICSAQKGNDGNPNTFWEAADFENGHYWQVDLEKSYDITGTKIVFNQPGNYMYVIHTSVDGKEWNVAVNKTGEISEKTICIDQFTASARYVKVTYNSLPQSIAAGHKQFCVYSN